ncbi:hypothetical protein JYT84_00205 [bacterium AH-315-M10]|nr:hypothetical protein [bacterium AH-315-M10]
MLRRGLAAVVAVLVLGIGVLSLVYMVRTRPKPEGAAKRDPGPLVRVFSVVPGRHQMVITAYGTSQAGEQWTAIAEVGGRAMRIDPAFEPGEFVKQGTELVLIDPTDYQLAVQRFKAEMTDKQARLKEIGQQQKNFAQLKQLRSQQVHLAKQELDRRKKLLTSAVSSQRELEQASSQYLAQLTGLQEIQNQLDLLPIQRSALQAGLALAGTRLKEAERNVARTRIQMPFAGRCVARAIKPNQFARAGEQLGRFISLDVARVLVMLEVRKLHYMFPKGVAGIGKLDFSQGSGFKLFERIHIPARVSWGAADRRFHWKGKVVRMRGVLDQATRTMGVVVEVPDPYKGINPGLQPPLLPDMFCEVRFFGAVFENAIVVPRDALRDDRVYLLREGKLKIVTVKVLAFQDELAIIQSGLASGDQVILSDLFPAIAGMPLRGQQVPNPARQQAKAPPK